MNVTVVIYLEILLQCYVLRGYNILLTFFSDLISGYTVKNTDTLNLLRVKGLSHW